MKIFFDLFLFLILLFLLIIPSGLVSVCVKLTSKGVSLYWSYRVGKRNQFFKMPKFRSMRTDTPTVATHLLQNPGSLLTSIGLFWRKSSLDELPQLWRIHKGDMVTGRTSTVSIGI